MSWGAGQVYLSFQKLALGDPLGAFERIAVLCLVSVIMVGNHWRWPGWYALLERAKVMQRAAGGFDYRVRLVVPDLQPIDELEPASCTRKCLAAEALRGHPAGAVPVLVSVRTAPRESRRVGRESSGHNFEGTSSSRGSS